MADLSKLPTSKLAEYVLDHTSGVLIQNSLFLSATFDLGVAHYFSTQGNGRRLIYHFMAPINAINVTAFARTFSFQERGEAEVMIPVGIQPSEIIQILEIGNNGSIIGRWYRQGETIIHEDVNNVPIPRPRFNTIFRLSWK